MLRLLVCVLAAAGAVAVGFDAALAGAFTNPAPAPLIGFGIPAAGGVLAVVLWARRFRRKH